MSRTSYALVLLALVQLGTGVASAGSVSVGAGSAVDLGTGKLGLGCTDLDVGGTLSAGGVGFDQARHVTIGPGGVLEGDATPASWSPSASRTRASST